jgi:plasmid maintenance system killer protein
LSCSVNYRYRIIFEWDDPNTIAVLSVGDHDVYR